MRNLQSDRNVINKPVDKVSAVVILEEAEKQLSGRSTYLETKVTEKTLIEKTLVDLIEQSKKMCKNL